MKRYRHIFNLEVYEPKVWEKILLAFMPLKIEETESMIFWYKEIRDRIYVYAHAHILVKDYNKSENVGTDVPPTTGYDKPWVN